MFLRSILKKEISTEFFVLSFFFYYDFMQLIFILATGYYVGDFVGWECNLTKTQIFFVFFLKLFIFLMAYLLYNKSKERRFKLRSITYNRKVHFYLDVFLFVYLLLNLLIIILTNTKAGFVVSNFYTFIIHILPLRFLFIFYYVLNRNDGNRIIFFVNVLLFTFNNVIQGFIGFALYLLFAEIFMRKERLPISYLLFIPLSSIILSFIYMFLYPLKLSIRTGESIDLYKIGLTEAFVLLIGRMSSLANSYVIIQYIDDILNLVSFLPDYFSLLRAIRVIIPGWIAKHIFSEEIVYYSYTYILWIFSLDLPITIIKDEGISINYQISFLGLIYLLFKKSWVELFSYILVVTFLLFLIKLFLDFLNCRKVYFSFWLIVVYFINESSTLETLSLFTLGLANFSFIVFILYSFSKNSKNSKI